MTTKKTKKRKTKRSKQKNPALIKKYNSRVRQEYLDYDYLNQLDEKQLAFLNSFTEETLGANFNHKGKKLIKKVREKRQIYNENNARNRCAYGRLINRAATKRLNYDDNRSTITEDLGRDEESESGHCLDSELIRNSYVSDYEDALIDFLDNKKSKK